jgi:hypothetical protein
MINETDIQIPEWLCSCIDWERDDLKDATFARAWQDGDADAACLGFVRHLRSREKPLMGYTVDYVEQLRASASLAFRKTAEAGVAELLGKSFQTGDHPDGRGTLLGARPEILQIGATRDDFEQYARLVAEGRNMWQQSKIHTIVNILRFLQFVWPLEECTDECLVPLFAFLTTAMRREWESTRKWGEVMLGSNGHNWWACQHGGIWKAGLLFPEFKEFEKFQAFHPTWFEREMSLLFYADGFTRECSVSYHLGTVDLILESVRLAHLNGLSFSQGFYEKLRLAAEVEWKLVQPNGTFPDFGDCHAGENYVAGRLRSNAALHQMPEAKHLAGILQSNKESQFNEMMIQSLHYPSVGENLRPSYDTLVARPPSFLDTALADSGYYAMRTDWSASADYAAIEASARGAVVSSHGQSAIFDLRICSRGRAILTGNGKGPDVSDMTNMDRIWRISNAAHSTATVDGEDHVPIRSIYRFDRVVVPTVEEWRSEEKYAYFSGSHESYERLEKKVPGSRRKLFYLRGDYWILIDRFTAASEDDPHEYQQHFQVGVPVKLSEDGRAVTEGIGGNLLFLPVKGACGDPSLALCPQPLEGYPSPDQLCYTNQTQGSFLFVTLLVPFLDADIPDVEAELVEVFADDRALSSWEATGLKIVINGRQDVYVDLHMHWNLPWECEGFAGVERLFHSFLLPETSHETS